MNLVIKRNKQVVAFDDSKIVIAILRAMGSSETNEDDNKTAIKIKNRVLNKLKTWGTDTPHVDAIHTLVEHSLMDAKLYNVARSYITYRDANKPDIFRPRTAIRPYEYPALVDYISAIRGAYWTHEHFSYVSDVQDIKVLMSEKESEAVIRSMLAISQIESAVKEFWGKIGNRLPKPEIKKVGATFAESEVRHEDAYSELIAKLGLSGRFLDLDKVPAINKRIQYLEKAHRNMKATDDRDFFETIILFSTFVENVSLFSQFLVIMSFNKHDNKLAGMSNAIEATSKEEKLHAQFGFDIVNIIKEENPEWFDDELIEYIKELTYDAFEAEKEIVDWIYELGDLEFAPKKITIEYIKKRLNDSLIAIGVDPVFGLDMELLQKIEWFDDEISVTKINDQFHKKSTNYNKSKAFAAENLF